MYFTGKNPKRRDIRRINNIELKSIKIRGSGKSIVPKWSS